MPSRNAFSGLEALLDTVPSRAGSAKEGESPEGPSPAPGNPPPTPATPAPPEPPPVAEKPAPAETPTAAAPARPTRPSASPAPRPPRRTASSPAGPDRPAARAGEPLTAATRTATTVPRPRPFSVKVPPDLLDRARNAAYWVPGVTLTGMIQEGLRAVVEQLQREHNGGKPFPARRGPVRTGRPLGR